MNFLMRPGMFVKVTNDINPQNEKSAKLKVGEILQIIALPHLGNPFITFVGINGSYTKQDIAGCIEPFVGPTSK